VILNLEIIILPWPLSMLLREMAMGETSVE